MGGWGKIEIKDHLSPAKAEVGAELGKTPAAPPTPLVILGKLPPIEKSWLRNETKTSERPNLGIRVKTRL